MGYYLSRNRNVERRYGMSRWPAMLNLARAYGWQAMGTVLDEESGVKVEGKWSGIYEAMAHQLVCTEDAFNLADALQRALTHFPRDDGEETLRYQVENNLWRPPNEWEAKALHSFLKNEAEIELEEKMLLDFIGYCREGAFRIF